MAIKLDQHFLVSNLLLERIASYTNKEDIILEIGAGHGELTKYLVKKARFVYANEIDKDLFKLEAENCRAVFGDILKIRFPEVNKIFGNIPYSLSEPLIERLFKEQFKEAYLLVSSSFFNILSRNNNTRLAILSSFFFDTEKLFDISKSCFNPVPRTDSVFLRLGKRHDMKRWERTAKEVWLQKDKYARNALAVALYRICRLTKSNIKILLSEYSFPDKRVYMLNAGEFLDIVNLIKDITDKIK